MNDFRETLYTVDAKGRRKWVYPTILNGYFRNRRKVVAIVLMMIYLLMPWITVGGSQAVHFDLLHRKFILFGTTFWATDTVFLFLTLAALGLSLFFFTSLFGRVWCGWACPETVFLEFLFRPIEEFLEGKANQRKKLDSSPWDLHKIRIKATKYFVFAVLAWILASTALAYFIGRQPLLAMMGSYPWHNWPTFLLTLALMSALMFQFGWFREQFCTVLCPYARFQSVLLDDSSLLVGYDAQRGEPRGKISQHTEGDCVDCALCVKVCPTGIDIRNGLQLECVQCAACADACDSVMVQIGKPKGLIRYDTELGLAGASTRFVRPRVVIYGTILLSIFAFLAYSLQTRALMQASIFHSTKSPLFTQAADGQIMNHLEIHIENKGTVSDAYTAVVIGEDSVRLVMPLNPFPVPANGYQNVPVFANFPASILVNGKKPITVKVSNTGGEEKILKVELMGPG